jgi:hypothetical protein
VADAGTLDLAVAPDGRAVVAFDRQADDVTATVSAAYRPRSGMPFGAPQALAAIDAASTPVLAAAPGPSTLIAWADGGGGWFSTGS